MTENTGTVGLLRNPRHVTLNEVKGLLTLVVSSSRRFFAALRMTSGGFFNSPTVPTELEGAGKWIRVTEQRSNRR